MGEISFGVGGKANSPDIQYQYQVINGNLAIFASTTIRDIVYGADADSLAALNADPTLIVGIASGPGSIGLQEVYNRLNGTWNQIPIRIPQVTAEEFQDMVGAMLTSGTRSGITVTYDDTNGRFNFSVP